jgi:phosphohistidine phosphatase
VEIILFRHGIAVDHEHWKGSDNDRPLSEEGRDRTKQAAQGLGRLKLEPDHVYSSPLLRARQTAEVIKEEMSLKSKIEVLEELLPDAPPDALLARLAHLPAQAVVLCAGHEPHLSTTIGVMISGKTTARVEMKKAAAGCVGFTGSPKPGGGILNWLLAPKILRLLGRAS